MLHPPNLPFCSPRGRVAGDIAPQAALWRVHYLLLTTYYLVLTTYYLLPTTLRGEGGQGGVSGGGVGQGGGGPNFEIFEKFSKFTRMFRKFRRTVGACAMTTKFLDNKIFTFKILLS